MEMLIVIAIIAVLIAVAIPVFASQLEKAREATDLANVRSAYAKVSTEALLGDSETTVTVDYRTSPIGSNSCGPDLSPDVAISEKHIDFDFTLTPGNPGNDDPGNL